MRSVRLESLVFGLLDNDEDTKPRAENDPDGHSDKYPFLARLIDVLPPTIETMVILGVNREAAQDLFRDMADLKEQSLPHLVMIEIEWDIWSVLPDLKSALQEIGVMLTTEATASPSSYMLRS